MINKCPNCDYEYNDGDIYCSRCGFKIVAGETSKIETSIKQFNLSESPIKEHYARFNKKITDNPVFSFGIFLITTLSALCLILFVILDKHDNQKEALKFKNLIENPSQIPILNEYSNYDKLAKNLNKVEDFLELYLRNSSDNQEKKEQIFIAYLNELDKLPNLLSQKIEDIEICSHNSSCLNLVNANLKDCGAIAYLSGDSIYLYPNYLYIEKKYEDYLSQDLKEYINLRARYITPVSLDLQLYVKPIDLGKKIADFEKLHLKTQNEYVKEKCEEILYNDVRKFIFSPVIYATTTQEMKKEFEKAYKYFIRKFKTSNLRPLLMSYMDKKRAYGEINFKNDYPYKQFDENLFENNVKNSTLEDVFVQLRKNIFVNKNIDLNLAYIYDVKSGRWKKYSTNSQLESGQYVLSEPDENNNVSIYNNVFSPMQELNILKYSKLYLISDNLYIYNQNKLNISKVTFNGKTFNTYNMNHSDITSLFPGIEVINIDSLQSYNVIIEKENKHANYIILSRYSQGWNNYVLELLKGDYNLLALPNMFSVNSDSDITILFRHSENNDEGFKEDKPSYKITIRTSGHKSNEEDKNIVHYDQQTQDNEENEKNTHKPNMMPKLKSADESVELEDESLLIVPEQKIEPPNEFD